jgi:hypothetical protein
VHRDVVGKTACPWGEIKLHRMGPQIGYRCFCLGLRWHGHGDQTRMNVPFPLRQRLVGQRPAPRTSMPSCPTTPPKSCRPSPPINVGSKG